MLPLRAPRSYWRLSRCPKKPALKMPNHGVVLAGPILAVLFDPTCPWSSSPLVCLTLHRDSGLKLFRALNQTRTQPSYQEGLLLIPHEICIIRSFRPTHTFRHSPATQHCLLSKAGETVVTPIWSSTGNLKKSWIGDKRLDICCSHWHWNCFDPDTICF